MDQVEIAITSVIYKRAALIEEFLRQHLDCWPGPTRLISNQQPLNEMVKCSCGAQLEIVILTKLVVNSYQPK